MSPDSNVSSDVAVRIVAIAALTLAIVVLQIKFFFSFGKFLGFYTYDGFKFLGFQYL